MHCHPAPLSLFDCCPTPRCFPPPSLSANLAQSTLFVSVRACAGRGLSADVAARFPNACELQGKGRSRSPLSLTHTHWHSPWQGCRPSLDEGRTPWPCSSRCWPAQVGAPCTSSPAHAMTLEALSRRLTSPGVVLGPRLLLDAHASSLLHSVGWAAPAWTLVLQPIDGSSGVPPPAQSPPPPPPSAPPPPALAAAPHPTCACNDTAPPGSSCLVERDAGNCFAPHMLEGRLCDVTCGRCSCPGACVCTDVPPSASFTCAQQATWNKVGRAAEPGLH